MSISTPLPTHSTALPLGVPASEDVFLDLDAEGLAAQADVAWIHEQFNLGNFHIYHGEYVAVVGQRVLGHNRDLNQLREEVSRTFGHAPSRIVTSFIDTSKR